MRFVFLILLMISLAFGQYDNRVDQYQITAKRYLATAPIIPDTTISEGDTVKFAMTLGNGGNFPGWAIGAIDSTVYSIINSPAIWSSNQAKFGIKINVSAPAIIQLSPRVTWLQSGVRKWLPYGADIITIKIIQSVSNVGSFYILFE